MRVIYDAKVYLVGSSNLRAVELTDFLDEQTCRSTWELPFARHDADIIPEIAGRLCYMSFQAPRPGGNQAYLQRIKEQAHGSVLEHTAFNFICAGISRTCTHELVRHRAGWGFSQLSQRYVDESEANFVVPWELQAEVRAALSYLNDVWSIDNDRGKNLFQMAPNCLDFLNTAADPRFRDGVDNTHFVIAGLTWLVQVYKAQTTYVATVEHLNKKIRHRNYNDYLHALEQLEHPRVDYPASEDDWFGKIPVEERTAMRKEARQAARSLLPNATETKIFCTANARALRHFFELRVNSGAESEIRRLAYQIYQKVLAEAPHIFEDYQALNLPDGTHELWTPNRKV